MIDYAATDAAVALHILQALVEIKLTRHGRQESVRVTKMKLQNQLHVEHTVNHIISQSRKTSAYSVRRTRLYHNCRLLAPDGQLLTMHKRKLEWYLDRERETLEVSVLGQQEWLSPHFQRKL